MSFFPSEKSRNSFDNCKERGREKEREQKRISRPILYLYDKMCDRTMNMEAGHKNHSMDKYSPRYAGEINFKTHLYFYD